MCGCENESNYICAGLCFMMYKFNTSNFLSGINSLSQQMESIER